MENTLEVPNPVLKGIYVQMPVKPLEQELSDFLSFLSKVTGPKFDNWVKNRVHKYLNSRT